MKKNNNDDKKIISSIIGFGFFLLGILLIVLKGLTGDYIDEYGILHEYFFLIPIGYLSILLGIILIVISKIKCKK